MLKVPFSYYCYVCGAKNEIEPEVPEAPKMKEYDVVCSQCEDRTHILITACPKCKKGVQYFLSDLDFPEEITRLGGAYVKLIEAIKNGIKDHVEEFEVPLPKRWTVGLECSCGEKYTAEIPLPQSSE